MIVPITSDQPKPIFSPVTHGLILLNVLVALLLNPGVSWAFDPAEPRLTSFFTSMFLHAGLLHLAGNMIVLNLVGRAVEWRLGPLRFLGLYIASGSLATIAQWVAAPALMCGASGAIAGIMGAFAVLCWSGEVTLFYWGSLGWLLVPLAQETAPDEIRGLGVVVILAICQALYLVWVIRREDAGVAAYFFGLLGIGTVHLRARSVILYWVGLQLFGLWLDRYSTASHVAFAAHLGGFVPGVVYALAALRAPRLGLKHFAAKAKESRETIAVERPTTRVRRAALRRELEELIDIDAITTAVQLYDHADRLDARPVLSAEAQEALANALSEKGEAALSVVALKDLIECHPGTAQAQRAMERLAPKTTRRRKRRELVESGAF